MKPIWIAVFSLALLSSPLCTDAQKFQPRSIQFHGNTEYSTEELLQAAGLKSGTLLNYADMNAHSKRLMDSGIFSGLSFKFDGQDLIFNVTMSSDLFPVRLVNFPFAEGKDLDAKLHTLFPLYHGRVPGEDGLREDVRQALETMLAAKGLKATVQVENAADPIHKTKVAAVEYSIVSPVVQLGAVQMDGVSDAFRNAVQGQIRDASGRPYRSDRTASDLQQSLMTFYEDKGHAAARVTLTRSGEAVMGGDKILIPYRLNVVEGKVYRMGKVTLPPNTPLTAAEVDAILHPLPGSGQAVKATENALSASLTVQQDDSVRLRALLAEIVRRYRSKGYVDCTATPQASFDDATGLANYTVSVRTGEVYHLGFVRFENVSDKLRAILTHNWQMMPGDPFNQEYVGDFILKLKEQEPSLRATLSGVKPVFDVMANPETHEVNVVLRLERAVPAS